VLELTMQKTHSNQVVYLNVSKTTVFIAKTNEGSGKQNYRRRGRCDMCEQQGRMNNLI